MARFLFSPYKLDTSRIISSLGYIELKENVIIEKLVPAGTGMPRYRSLKFQLQDQLKRGNEQNPHAEETVLVD